MKIKNLMKRRSAGFTLIEMLVVIGIIAILAAVVLVAVNPLRQFQSARDSQRRSDVYTITNAVYQYAIENNGNLPAGIPTNAATIGTGGVDLAATLVPVYIADIPCDPSQTEATCAEDSLYWISQGASGRITASAAGELTPVISISR